MPGNVDVEPCADVRGSEESDCRLADGFLSWRERLVPVAQIRDPPPDRTGTRSRDRAENMQLSGHDEIQTGEVKVEALCRFFPDLFRGRMAFQVCVIFTHNRHRFC